MADRAEIRFEAPSLDLAVLNEWSRDRLHEATLICRVAGVNPMASEGIQQ